MKLFYLLAALTFAIGSTISGCKKPLLDFNVNVNSMDAKRLGDTLTIGIKSNTEWTVTSSEEWCVPSFSSANKIATLKLFVEPNTNGVSRYCDVRISVNSTVYKDITVNQSGSIIIFLGCDSGIQYSLSPGGVWVNPIYSYSINDLCMDGNNIYAPSTTGTIFNRSKDHGVSWSEIPKLYGKGVQTTTSITNVVIGATKGNGVFISNNNCTDWTNVKLSASDNSKNYIYAICNNGNKVFAATGNGVMLSPDYGFSWHSCPGTDGTINYIC